MRLPRTSTRSTDDRSPRWKAAATVGVVLTLALTSLVTAAAATTDPSPAATSDHPHHATVLHFGVRFSPFNLIDVPPVAAHEGDVRPGDYVVFSDTLVNRAGATVGTEGGTGVVTRVTATDFQVHYDMTVQLKRGQIAAQGLSTSAPTKRLAVVGGTGRYVGARGSVALVENGDGTGSLTIRLRQ